MHLPDAIAVFLMSTSLVSYFPHSLRVLEQLQEVLRSKQYSLCTEKAYLYWVRLFSAGMDAMAMCTIRTVQELPGHSEVSTTIIYTHVLKVAAGGTASPLGALSMTA